MKLIKLIRLMIVRAKLKALQQETEYLRHRIKEALDAADHMAGLTYTKTRQMRELQHTAARLEATSGHMAVRVM
jgi:hypothetical protein